MSSRRETVIEGDALHRGRILGQDDVRILGTVVGLISVEARVTVEASGLVEGDIRADEVVILGTVRGQIQGRARIVLEDGARVLGDLSSTQLVLQEGARVRGRVRTDGGPVAHLAEPETALEAPESEVPLVVARPVDELEDSSAPPAREAGPDLRARRPRLRVKVRRRPVSPEVS